MIAVVILYALFAASIVGSKLLLPYTKPIFLTGARMLMGGVVLLAYQYFHPHQEFKFNKKDKWLYAQLIVFGIYITYILRFWALEYMPAFKTTFIYNLSPFLTALYCFFLFNENMSKKQWAGLSIGMIGLIPILIGCAPEECGLGEFLFISWPEIAVIISVATNSYSWIITRTLVKDKNYSPMMVNGISMTAGGLLALITSPFFEGFLPITNYAIFFGYLTFIVIVSNIICHNLYGHLLRTHTPTLLSFAGFITPFFAAGYEWVLRGTHITWHFYASSAIVFVGLFLFYQDELRFQKIVE